MKWPESLTAIRHAESAYNKLKRDREQDPLYKAFRTSYETKWDSQETRQFAVEVMEKFSLGVGDHNTPLSENAADQARTTAEKLKGIIKVPDVIFYSPYQRTVETLDLMKEKWPDLNKVPMVEEERIREQDHGLALLYNDWRVFNVLNPDQKNLYDLQREYWYRYPNGENILDLRERIRSWLTTLSRDYRNQKVLAVTHHLTILSIRANLERLDANEFLRLDKQEKPINCGVTIYNGNPNQGVDGKLVLDLYNAKFY